MRRILSVVLVLCLLFSGCSLGSLLEGHITPDLLMSLAALRLDALESISAHSSTVCDYSENGKNTYRAIDLDGSVLFDEQRLYANMRNETGATKDTERVYMDMANDDFVAYYNIDDAWHKSDYLPYDLRLDMNILYSIRTDFNYIFSLMQNDKNLKFGHYDFNGNTYYMLKTEITPSFDDVEKLNLNSFAEFMGGVYYGSNDSFKNFWQKGGPLDVRVYFDMDTLIPYACLINLAPFTEQAFEALGRNVEAHEIYMCTIFNNCNTAEVNIPQAAKDAPEDASNFMVLPDADPMILAEIEAGSEVLDIMSDRYLANNPDDFVVFAITADGLAMDIYMDNVEATDEQKRSAQDHINQTYPEASADFDVFKELYPSIKVFIVNILADTGDPIASYRFDY